MSLRKRWQCLLARPCFLVVLTLLAAHSQVGLAAQLTFRQTIELAAQQSLVGASASADLDEAPEVCGEPGVYLLEMTASSSWFGSSEFPPAVNGGPVAILDIGVKRSVPKSLTALGELHDAQSQASPVSTQSQRRHALLCAATTYAELAKINLQVETRRRQEKEAKRLLNVETRRAVARVDTPAMLTRAKLLAARAKMWTEHLETSKLRLRKQLASLTGLHEEEIETVPTSIPVLPDAQATDPEMQAKVRELNAARNVIQLEHVLARTHRKSVRGKMVVDKANLGEFLAARIAECDSFIALIEMNFELQRAQLQLLDMTGQLEMWSLDHKQFSSTSLGASSSAAENNTLILAPEDRTKPPGIRLIMITPALSELAVGESQQFSAIAVYNDGTAKDATPNASWSCSNNWGAITSTAGLVTGVQSGEVTITATVAGVSHSRTLTIASDDWRSSDP